MNKVTDLVNPDFKKDNDRLARDMVDYGISLAMGFTQRNKDIYELYRMYHGKYTAKEKTAMTLVHGKTSATPLKAYKLAKVKIDQLLGESLEVGFSIEVDTISPVEKAKKQEDMMKTVGRSLAKPMIESAQRQGFRIYDGVKIPDFKEGMALDMQEYRTRNELISQRIVDEKIKDARQKNLYYYLFASNLFASEIFSRCYIDARGKTSIEYIEPERIIYPSRNFDQYNETVGIIGHRSLISFADTVRKFNVEKDSAKYNELVQIFSAGASSFDPADMMSNYGEFNLDGIANPNQYTQNLASLYEFQWRYYVDKVAKKDLNGSVSFYDLDDDEVERFKKEGINYETLRFERLYQGASINGTCYLGFGDVKGYAVSRDEMGRIHANYDYTCTLVKTFGGYRTSFAKVLLDLNSQYDYARWLLFREIKKQKGSAIYVNKAFMGTKTTPTILYELEDQGVLEFNSKEKFDETGEGLLNGNQVIGQVQAGTSSNMIRDLISICMDLERVQDTITGMNDSRKGTEMATTTATTAQNNLQASRSVTYDMFHFTESHMERAFTQLVQKTKSVLYNGSKEAYSYLPVDDLEYLAQSPDFFRDNFEARIVGGRRSQQIFAELSNVIMGEVAAGKRSSKDFVEIKQSESLTEAVEILRLSDERLQAIAKQSEDATNQTKLQLSQQQIEANKENREDVQLAEKDKQDSINQTSMATTALKVQAQLMAPHLEPPSSGASPSKKSK